MGDNEPLIDIEKSTRHHHIVGRFGEYLVCNWLSRSGFKVCIVDHTGLDVIAYHPIRKQRFGITVKSRTRSFGTEATAVFFQSLSSLTTFRSTRWSSKFRIHAKRSASLSSVIFICHQLGPVVGSMYQHAATAFRQDLNPLAIAPK
jgi:hypothetical protein